MTGEPWRQVLKAFVSKRGELIALCLEKLHCFATEGDRFSYNYCKLPHLPIAKQNAVLEGHFCRGSCCVVISGQTFGGSAVWLSTRQLLIVVCGSC